MKKHAKWDVFLLKTHFLFIFLMNIALFLIHEKIHSIVQQKYSFKEFINSKNNLIIHSIRILIFWKNAVLPVLTLSASLDHSLLRAPLYSANNNWKPGLYISSGISSWIFSARVFFVLGYNCALAASRTRDLLPLPRPCPSTIPAKHLHANYV